MSLAVESSGELANHHQNLLGFVSIRHQLPVLQHENLEGVALIRGNRFAHQQCDVGLVLRATGKSHTAENATALFTGSHFVRNTDIETSCIAVFAVDQHTRVTQGLCQ